MAGGGEVTEVLETKDLYLAEFERLHGAANESRKRAIQRFAELGFPTLHDEPWRFTDVTPITEIPFRTPSGAGEVSDTELEGPL